MLLVLFQMQCDGDWCSNIVNYGLIISLQDLKIEGDVPEAVEPEDDLDIMLGNKKKKKKNVKFPDEDEIMEKDEGKSITQLN